MNVIEGLGINSNYVHRWLSTQCYQDFWVAYPQMITMLLSIQAAKSVTEYTEHRAGGCCYSQLTLCSEYSCDGNLRSWSLQQCQTALPINPPSLLEFKQDSVDSVKSQKGYREPSCISFPSPRSKILLRTKVRHSHLN